METFDPSNFEKALRNNRNIFSPALYNPIYESLDGVNKVELLAGKEASSPITPLMENLVKVIRRIPYNATKEAYKIETLRENEEASTIFLVAKLETEAILDFCFNQYHSILLSSESALKITKQESKVNFKLLEDAFMDVEAEVLEDDTSAPMSMNLLKLRESQKELVSKYIKEPLSKHYKKKQTFIVGVEKKKDIFVVSVLIEKSSVFPLISSTLIFVSDCKRNRFIFQETQSGPELILEEGLKHRIDPTKVNTPNFKPINQRERNKRMHLLRLAAGIIREIPNIIKFREEKIKESENGNTRSPG